jgi:hypothetical protein
MLAPPGGGLLSGNHVASLDEFHEILRTLALDPNRIPVVCCDEPNELLVLGLLVLLEPCDLPLTEDHRHALDNELQEPDGLVLLHEVVRGLNIVR